MLKLNGYPIVAKYTHINTGWSTTDNTDTNFESATLMFDSINLVANAGEITKGRTSLGFDVENPIPWKEGTPQAIKDAFDNPQDALIYVLTELYESDEHQYQLGTKERPPEPTE